MNMQLAGSGNKANALNIQPDYVERVYAGWLGKVIGVRHGGNIENWTYEKIERTFGEITGYLHQFKNFAADDDTNGPVFFLKALTDYTYTSDIQPQHMGLTLLNYAPDGHGFFWWGGYGNSTEHTAYLNLKHGIPAPRSGSMEQNGVVVAEQIGGQIFIDVWGLIAPGKPQLAAQYAEKMASVTHDGNGKYGGMFIAACIAEAFVERDIHAILQVGLSVIPNDCTYARMTRKIIEYYSRHPDDWRACFKYVQENFGYDKHPGVCHIIPNAAVIVLSLLYGEGDFSKTINICNMCGWDTDCNVGNVGTIMGVRNGLSGIDSSWRQPINDFLCCSSVIGAWNIADIPGCAAETARIGYQIAGKEVPERWEGVLKPQQERRFHFEFPGSTHAFRFGWDAEAHITAVATNTDEVAAEGERSLKLTFDRTRGGEGYRAYVQTYYGPEDFNDSRYDPSFSPIFYPGQTVSLSAMLHPSITRPVLAKLYVYDAIREQRLYSDPVRLASGQWMKLSFTLPAMDSACIREAGIEFIPEEGLDEELIAYVDDMSFTGQPNYAIDMAKLKLEKWNTQHIEVSQLTYLRGLWTLENGQLSGSYCGEPAECYTGDIAWTDYRYTAQLTPMAGDCHHIQFRVQGGIRSYAAGLAPNGKLALYKNDNGYRLLAEADLAWTPQQEITLSVEARGSTFRIFADGALVLHYTDHDQPYLNGQIGFSNMNGSRTYYRAFSVTGI